MANDEAPNTPLPEPNIPTFEEQGMTLEELELLEHWTKLSPQMATQREAEGDEGFLGMLVRKRLIRVNRMIEDYQRQNPHLHPSQVREIFMEERWVP